MTRTVIAAIEAGQTVDLRVTPRTVRGWERDYAGRFTFRWVPRSEPEADETWKVRVYVLATLPVAA